MLRLLTVLFATFTVAATTLAASPDDVARKFLDLNLSSRVQGLPSEEQMKAYGPLMTAELKKLIEEARKEQEAFAKKNPDEKPPWIEGALFSSLFEGVTRYRLGKGTQEQEFFTVPVYWEYAEGGQTARWIDLLILGQEGKTWKVRDIIYGAPWDFRPGPSLRGMLQARE
jgi:hypothetical protein